MKKLIGLVLTVIVFGVIFMKVDNVAVFSAFRQTNLLVFAIALILFIPQIWFISVRWRLIAGVVCPVSLGDSVRMVLASQTLNLFLPSKVGDLAKAEFLRRSPNADSLRLSCTTCLVIYEKLLDVISLFAVLVLGALCYPASRVLLMTYLMSWWCVPTLGVLIAGIMILWWLQPLRILTKKRPELASLGQTLAALVSERRRGVTILFLSIAIWLAHLVQIWFFFLALAGSLGGMPSLSQFIFGVPMAIFIGLVPLTVAGFGARDAALIGIFANFPAEAVLAVSLYVNLRYILPAIAGIPFISQYFPVSESRKNSP